MESHFPIPPSHQHHLARERVLEDVRALVVDGELLLKATASELGEKAAEARHRLVAMIRRAKGFLDNCRAEGLTSTRLAAEAKICEHPFAAVAAGIGAGFCAGALLAIAARRRPKS